MTIDLEAIRDHQEPDISVMSMADYFCWKNQQAEYVVGLMAEVALLREALSDNPECALCNHPRERHPATCIECDDWRAHNFDPVPGGST